ncbi:TcaA NTF2-like domain-containing protein [Rummeliibacillus sp. JY-2-4R]
MNKWKLISSICLTASLIVGCGNNTQKNSEEPKVTEAFTTETPTIDDTSQSKGNTTTTTTDQKQEVEVTGQKMSAAEQQKLSDFIAMYPVTYAEALHTGDFSPLANEYIMHDTKLYEDLLAEIPEKHKQGIQEEVNKVEILSINRSADTDFTVTTKEVIAEIKSGSKKMKEFKRQYKVYYNFVEDDESNSFFQISDIKEIK